MKIKQIFHSWVHTDGIRQEHPEFESTTRLGLSCDQFAWCLRGCSAFKRHVVSGARWCEWLPVLLC